MKKIVAVMTIVVLLLTFASCGKKGSQKNSQKNGSETTTQMMAEQKNTIRKDGEYPEEIGEPEKNKIVSLLESLKWDDATGENHNDTSYEICINGDVVVFNSKSKEITSREKRGITTLSDEQLKMLLDIVDNPCKDGEKTIDSPLLRNRK